MCSDEYDPNVTYRKSKCTFVSAYQDESDPKEEETKNLNTL